MVNFRTVGSNWIYIFWNKIMWNEVFMKILQKSYHLSWMKKIFIPSIPMEYMKRNGMKLKIVDKQKVSWIDGIRGMKKNKITVLYYLDCSIKFKLNLFPSHYIPVKDYQLRYTNICNSIHLISLTAIILFVCIPFFWIHHIHLIHVT